MKIEIRPARPEDAKGACDVLRRTISECCAEDHRNDSAVLDVWLGNKTPENVETWFRSAAQYPLVAIGDGAIVGVATLNRLGKILLFYVAPEVRFHGVGKALLQALEEAAAGWGARSLCVASTFTAQSFYLRNGFAESGMTQSAFGTEAVTMSKKLAAGSAKKSPCRCSAA
jgi:GNAT superfamily N-acetyltransferase